MNDLVNKILEKAKPFLEDDVFTFDKFMEIKLSVGGTVADYKYISQGNMCGVQENIPCYLAVIIKAYEVYGIYARAYIPPNISSLLSEYTDHIEPSDLFSNNVSKNDYLEFLKQCYLRNRIPIISSSVKIA